MKGVRTAAVEEPPTAAARTVAPAAGTVTAAGTGTAVIGSSRHAPKILASSSRIDKQTDGQVQVRWKVFMQYLDLGLGTESYRSLDLHLYCLICIISAWCGYRLNTGDRMLRTLTPCRDDTSAGHTKGNFLSVTGCRVAGVLFALSY